MKRKNIPPGYREMSKVISQRNKNKNWVERGLNPNDFPFIENEDGTQSTHKLAYSTFDDGAMVFPTIIQNEDKTLKEFLSVDDAYNHAMENNTGVFIPNWDLAKYYSENGLIEHYSKGGTIKNKNNMRRKKLLTGGELQALSTMTQAAGGFANSIYDLSEAIKYKPPGMFDNATVNTGIAYANGGQIPVEVEGGEMYETPDGQMGMFQGADHEQGGINTQLPEGTEIFSKRLKIGGKTMAERKAIREIRKKKAELSFSKRKGDPITKSTFKRTIEMLEREEQGDVELMNQINEMQQQQVQPEQSFAPGGKITGVNLVDFYNEYILQGQKKYKDSIKKMPELSRYKPRITSPLEKRTLSPIDSITIAPFEGIPMWGNLSKYYPKFEETKTDYFTPGDEIGMASTMIGGISQPLLTLSNRLGDKRPKNWYQDIGKDEIQSLQGAKGASATRRMNNLFSLDAETNSMNKMLEGSARGINTKRALRMAGEGQRYKNKGQIESQFLQEQSELERMLGTALTNREKASAAGKENIYNIEEEQRDNYFNALSQNFQDMTQSGQTLGKNMNENQYKDLTLDLLSKISGIVDIVPDGKGGLSFIPKEERAFGGTLKKRRRNRK